MNTPDFASFFNGIGSGFGGYNFGGFGDLPVSQLGEGLWSFGTGVIGKTGTGAGKLQFYGNADITSGGSLGIYCSSGFGVAAPTILLGGGTSNIYKNVNAYGNDILSRNENNNLYAYKSHTHSQYYKSGDSAYFSSVIASNGYNGNISVMKRSGTGGYGITITYGIITAVANI